MIDLPPDSSTLRDYLQQRLSPEDEARLELWLADHPEVIAELQNDLLLRDGAHAAASDTPKVKGKKNINLLKWFLSPWLLPLHLAAYTTAAVLWVEHSFMNESIQGQVAFVLLEKQRSANNTERQVRLVENQPLVIQLYPESLTKTYTLRFQSRLSGAILVIKNLMAGNDGSITVSIERKEMNPGLWEIKLSDLAAEEEQIYQLVVVDN